MTIVSEADRAPSVLWGQWEYQSIMTDRASGIINGDGTVKYSTCSITQEILGNV